MASLRNVHRERTSGYHAITDCLRGAGDEIASLREDDDSQLLSRHLEPGGEQPVDLSSIRHRHVPCDMNNSRRPGEETLLLLDSRRPLQAALDAIRPIGWFPWTRHAWQRGKLQTTSKRESRASGKSRGRRQRQHLLPLSPRTPTSTMARACTKDAPWRVSTSSYLVVLSEATKTPSCCLPFKEFW